MSKLSGPEIHRLVKAGEILIDPFDEAHLGPNSYDLRLDTRLLVYKVADKRDKDHSHARLSNGGHRTEIQAHCDLDWCLDMAKENPVEGFDIHPGGTVLFPGVLYLGSTVERTCCERYVPIIEGRSSVARLGLQPHVSAGFGDHGFDGHWTLEIMVAHPLRVYAGVRICQIAFEPLVGEPKPYAGKYQGQRGPQPSRLYRDFDQGWSHPPSPAS